MISHFNITMHATILAQTLDKRSFRKWRVDYHRGLRALPKDLTLVPAAEWPNTPTSTTQKRVAVWRSRDYLVQVFDQGGITRMTVSRTRIKEDGNWEEGITWDELMAIKTAIGYGDQWAVEIFPPVEHLVNVGNLRHLFIVDEPDFGWVRAAKVEGATDA